MKAYGDMNYYHTWLICLICPPGSRDGSAALSRGATGLSAVCDCGIS